MNTLIDHLRQYRHNSSDELVFGYEKEGVDKLVAGLEARIAMLESACQAVKHALETQDMGGDVLFIHPPHQAPAIHETAWERLDEAIGQSPTTCLAEIQAAAIEEFQAHFEKEYYGEDLSQFIERYADSLRDSIQEQIDGKTT